MPSLALQKLLHGTDVDTKNRKLNMNLDTSSLSIGFVIGTAFGALITGFFKKMGEDAYASAKQIFSQDPKFVEVDRRYEPDCSDGACLSWVPEARLYECKNAGFKYRIIGDKNQGCFRTTHDRRSTFKEYLMKKPE
jgi:hypothetical protein